MSTNEAYDKLMEIADLAKEIVESGHYTLEEIVDELETRIP